MIPKNEVGSTGLRSFQQTPHGFAAYAGVEDDRQHGMACSQIGDHGNRRPSVWNIHIEYHGRDLEPRCGAPAYSLGANAALDSGYRPRRCSEASHGDSIVQERKDDRLHRSRGAVVHVALALTHDAQPKQVTIIAPPGEGTDTMATRADIGVTLGRCVLSQRERCRSAARAARACTHSRVSGRRNRVGVPRKLVSAHRFDGGRRARGASMTASPTRLAPHHRCPHHRPRSRREGGGGRLDW